MKKRCVCRKKSTKSKKKTKCRPKKSKGVHVVKPFY